MAEAARAGMSGTEFAGPRLGVLDEFLERAHREGARYDEEVRRHPDERGADELGGPELRVGIEGRVHRHEWRSHHQRVAVRWRAPRQPCADVSARAGLGLDEDRLAP